MTTAARGDRVRITGVMQDEPDPMPVGAEGTVEYVLGGGADAQIIVDWDTHDRSLMLLPHDPFVVIGRATPTEGKEA